jgi:hypothetical protein
MGVFVSEVVIRRSNRTKTHSLNAEPLKSVFEPPRANLPHNPVSCDIIQNGPTAVGAFERAPSRAS